MNEDRWPTGLTGRAPVRRPGGVPDEGVDALVEIGSGVDTDGDAVPDTVLTTDGADLLVYTDLDADGLADRVLRIDTGGAVRPDPHLVGGPTSGSARAGWSGLLGVFFGPDP